MSETIPMTEAEAAEINKILESHDEGCTPCGLRISWDGGRGQLITAAESSLLGYLPGDALILLGKCIKDAGMPFATVTCSHNPPDGGECRIYPDGRIRFPELVYSEPESEAGASVTKHRCDFFGVSDFLPDGWDAWFWMAIGGDVSFSWANSKRSMVAACDFLDHCEKCLAGEEDTLGITEEELADFFSRIAALGTAYIDLEN